MQSPSRPCLSLASALPPRLTNELPVRLGLAPGHRIREPITTEFRRRSATIAATIVVSPVSSILSPVLFTGLAQAPGDNYHVPGVSSVCPQCSSHCVPKSKHPDKTMQGDETGYDES